MKSNLKQKVLLIWLKGKEVFSIPGDITREQSQGCNELIKDGAIIITSTQEILDIIKY